MAERATVTVWCACILAVGCEQPPERPESFVARYAEAVNLRDLGKLQALMHPECRDFHSEMARPVLARIDAHRFGDKLDKIQSIRLVRLAPGLRRWRVPPTHRIFVDYEIAEDHHGGLRLDVKSWRGEWRIVDAVRADQRPSTPFVKDGAPVPSPPFDAGAAERHERAIEARSIALMEKSIPRARDYLTANQTDVPDSWRREATNDPHIFDVVIERYHPKVTRPYKVAALVDRKHEGGESVLPLQNTIPGTEIVTTRFGMVFGSVEYAMRRLQQDVTNDGVPIGRVVVWMLENPTHLPRTAADQQTR